MDDDDEEEKVGATTAGEGPGRGDGGKGIPLLLRDARGTGENHELRTM